jgi:hypothetical protein
MQSLVCVCVRACVCVRVCVCLAVCSLHVTNTFSIWAMIVSFVNITPFINS